MISLSGIAAGTSVRAAGDMFTRSIIEHLRRTRGLLVGERTAERIKMEIGSAKPMDDPREKAIRGRDRRADGAGDRHRVRRGCPGRPAPSRSSSCCGRCGTSSRTRNPSFPADLVQNGVVLTGGGALLRGLPDLLSEETGLSIRVADRPLDCVVNGAGLMLDQMDLLQQVSKVA